jgi:hypothetical protein
VQTLFKQIAFIEPGGITSMIRRCSAHSQLPASRFRSSFYL